MKSHASKTIALLLMMTAFIAAGFSPMPATAQISPNTAGFEIKLPPNLPLQAEYLGFSNGAARIRITNLTNRPIFDLKFKACTFAAPEDRDPALTLQWSVSSNESALGTPMLEPNGTMTGNLSIPPNIGGFKRAVVCVEQFRTDLEVWNAPVDESTIGFLDPQFADSLPLDHSTPNPTPNCNDEADAVARACKKYYGGGVSVFVCEQIPGGVRVTYRCTKVK